MNRRNPSVQPWRFPRLSVNPFPEGTTPCRQVPRVPDELAVRFMVDPGAVVFCPPSNQSDFCCIVPSSERCHLFLLRLIHRTIPAQLLVLQRGDALFFFLC